MNFSLNLQGCKYISLNIKKINLTYIIGHTLLDIHYWTYIIGHTLMDIHYWTYIIIYRKLLGIIKLYYDEINN